MANNRMILLCNVCQPSDTAWAYHEKGVLAITKWYPGGKGEEGAPYYSNRSSEQLGEALLTFLDEHKHGELPSQHHKKGAGQPNPIRLVYESEDLPKNP